MTWKEKTNISEPENTEPELEIEIVDDDETESAASPEDSSGPVEADLKKAREESAEWQDRFLRKAAEFENFRKRAAKEKTDSAILAKSSILLELLPVADACERALQSLDQGKGVSSEIGQYHEGVELLYKQLLDTLNRVGVVPIESEGKPFDPHLHEALSRKEDSNYDEDTVIQELRRGYLFKEKLLRPAQVIVAVNSGRKDEES